MADETAANPDVPQDVQGTENLLEIPLTNEIIE
jgi:hypothetical protein